jgi:histidinol-phosphate aminotransferase
MSLPACLRPDVPGPTTFTVTELGDRLVAKLDQNESAVDLPAELKERLVAELAASSWNRYPQPSAYVAARRALAEALGLPPDCVALTVGGDQVIQAAFLLAGGAGRRARWFEPVYPYVPLAARVTGTIADPVVLGEDVDRLDAATIVRGHRADLVVLVSPNNPTGGVCSDAALEAALADDRRLVLLDEAYADFADSPSRLTLATERSNLIVGRSLSKSLCAGVRLGFAVAHPQIVATIERIYTAPYHLSAWQLLVAQHYGAILPLVRASAASVKLERARVLAALTAAGVRALPSQGNFVYFGVADAAGTHARLAARGIRVRNVSGLPGVTSALRVTIGTAAENDAFLAALAPSL